MILTSGYAIRFLPEFQLLRWLVVFALATAGSATAATRTKANNSNDLNLNSSWVFSLNPGSADVAQWNSTVTTANTVNLGTDRNWQGLKIANPGGLVTLNPGNMLTLGTGGIDMSTATANLSLNCGLNLSANQIWNVGNNAVLTLGGIITGTGITVTKTGFGAANLNNVNSFIGTLSINGGNLGVSNPGALGFAEVSVSTSSQLYLGGAGTYTNSLTLTGQGPDFLLGEVRFGGGAGIWSGPITLAGGGTIGSYSGGGAYTISGGVSGTGNLRFLAGGASAMHVQTYTLIGPCTYTGETVLDTYAASPVVVLSGAANRLPTNTVLNLLAGVWNGQVLSATVRLNGNNQTVAGLTTGPGVFGSGGTNRVVNGSGTLARLTVNADTAYFFDGFLGGHGANENNLGLTKNGAGKLTINKRSTHTGSTLLNGGTLNMPGGFSGGLIAVANGATLQLAGGTNIMSGLTLNSGATLAVNVGSPANPKNTAIQVNGNLVLGGKIIVQDLGDGTPGDIVTVFRYTGGFVDLGLTTDPRSQWNVQVDTATAGQVKLILQSRAPMFELITASATVSNSLQFELRGISRGLTFKPVWYEVRTPDGQLWDFGTTPPITNWIIRLRHLRLGTNHVRVFTQDAGNALQEDTRQIVLQLGSNPPVRPRPYPAELWWGGVATDLGPDYGYSQLVADNQQWDFVRQFQDGIFLHTFLPTSGTLGKLVSAVAPFVGRFAREGTYNTQADLNFGFKKAVQLNSEEQGLAGVGVHTSFYSLDYNPGMDVWPQVVDPGWCQNWPNWTRTQLLDNNMQCWTDFVGSMQTNWPGLKLGMTWSPVWFNWNGYPALISSQDKLTLHPVRDAFGNVVNNQYGTNAWFDFNWQEFLDKASVTAQAGDGYYGFATDCPWDYFQLWANASERASNQAKILGYEAAQRTSGYFSTTICNLSAGSSANTNAWDATYTQSSFAYMIAKQRMGGRTQKYLFESWYPGPYTWVPESNTNTFTGIIKQAIKYLKGINDPNGTLEALNLTDLNGSGSFRQIRLQNNGDIQCLPALLALPGNVPGVTTRFFSTNGIELTASMQTAEGLSLTNLLQPGTGTNLIAVTTASGLIAPTMEAASLEAFWNPQDPLGIVRDRKWFGPTLTPLGSWQSQDIGGGGLAGGVGVSSNVFSLIGSGSDIFGTADAFRFVYLPVTGDATITARVSAQLNPDAAAKAGVMVRESLAAGARHTLMALTPGSGAAFISRGTINGTSANVNRAGLAAPYWVRMVRSGSVLTGYYSSDGNSWTQLGSANLTGLATTVCVGLAVTSRNIGRVNVATFDSVKVSASLFLSSIANQTNVWNQPTAPIPFTIGSDTTLATNLSVTASSSDSALVPNGNLILSGTDSNRFLVITPLTNQTGVTTITLAVTDGVYGATNTFLAMFYQTNYASAPWISDVPDQTNAWNEAADPVPFNVGSDSTSVSNLIVTASSSNPVLVPSGNLILGGAGSNRFLTLIPVANQFGTTTVTLTVADGPLTATTYFFAAFYQTNFIPTPSARQDSVMLANPSFEWGYNPSGVHAHDGIPFGWTPSVNQIGINDTNGPFWDNGAAVDGSYVGYIQGVAADAGALAQANSGFEVGATYWIQFFANSRQSNSITPISSATTATLAVVETASTSGATALATNLNIPYADAVGTTGGGNPFTFVNIPFVAAASDGVLTIEKTSATPGGRSAVLLDGFSIIRRTTNDIVVANPSFEASDTNQPYPGYLETVAGWTKLGGGSLAINQSGGLFADNGLLPDGQSVLVLQSAATETVGVSQVLSGFTPGATYRLFLTLNGRAFDALNGYSNLAVVTIGGQMAYHGPVAPVESINGRTNPFLFVNFDFIAPATLMTLQIENQAIGGGSLLVDNVRVLAPFYISLQPHPDGLEIVWPVGDLQSSTNVSGPWHIEADAISPWVVTPSGTMKFYRAVLP